MGRPVWIWIILILTVISALGQLGSIFLIYSGAVPLPPEIVDHIADVPADDILVTLFVQVYFLAAAVALFMLRRIAVPLFLAGIGIELLVYAWQYLAYSWEDMGGNVGLITAILSIGLTVVIWCYALSLDRRGALA